MPHARGRAPPVNGDTLDTPCALSGRQGPDQTREERSKFGLRPTRCTPLRQRKLLDASRTLGSFSHNHAIFYISAPTSASRAAMRYEETVVVSPGGWTTRVTIHEFGPSPGGTTERILRSQSYNFKNGADNETEEQRKSREAVKRNARRRATDRFDEEKTEAKKSQRRKGAALTPAPLAITAGSPAVAAPLPPFADIPTPSPPTASNEQDLKTRRDRLGDPARVPSPAGRA